ncbi:unnamed protein product [Danaus chrysippus]|uniref:(African queen) hypothetical protein n=1 Tax=Danaus chrysippus TaxID=151541 RepID=A0A8J2W1K8_9NEOP|nr:unnamed protein product [Danaus chrysippus]
MCSACEVFLDEDAKKYEAYLAALKQLRRKSSYVEVTPREKHRNQESKKQALLDGISGTWSTVQQATRIAIIASLVPDEIIYRHSDHAVRSYETALMFIDVSGFTKLCETYTKTGGGPSRLTQVLNSYIGAMVQEILTHKGDVLKFSGDAFLSMWKKSPRLNMQDVVHTAIDCGLLIQKNYGRYMTDVGVVLKVKVAISAGLSHFSIIGGGNISQTQYVIVGQPVWDVKMAEYMSAAGDVLTSASAWMYVNEAEYCTQPCGDGRHTKVLGVGASWKRVEKLRSSLGTSKESEFFSNENLSAENFIVSGINYREYAHRPAVVAAMRGSWWPALRQFMVPPILRAVDNDEPMDFLTEIRHVVVVCINIITRTVTETVLIEVVDTAYKCVCSVTSEAGGLVNKISMFDKDMMLLVVFGLRGLKHEDEAQKALQCASQLKESLDDVNIINVSIAVTSGLTYCGVVGHVLRREYTVIGSAVNKAARLMMAYPNKVTCDKETFLKSKLNQECFKLVEIKPLKGICKPGPIYEFSNPRKTERITYCRHPILGRNEELRKYKMTLHNALDEHQKSFTRYRDHKFGVAFIGPKLVGKTRLMQECINITPSFVIVDHFVLTEKDKLKFGIIRLIMKSIFKCGGKLLRENRENRILTSIDMTSLGPLEIYAINTVFDCRFPLPENYAPASKFLDQFKVKEVIKEICRVNLPTLRVIAIAEGQYIDDDSWHIIILLLGAKLIFLLVSISEEETLSATATICLANAMIVKLPLSGIDRWYHAALACQLLDVQAIQSDLEKIIESASEGLPGWIQNFVISLVQRGQLTMMTMSRSEALEMGAVTPSPALLETDTTNTSFEDIECSKDSYSYVLKQGSVAENEMIQMAVLTDTYDFENMKVDVKMDALILKTYDSLTPFEKMLLKCGSVLGEVFSRCMLLHLLQSDSPRKVAQAVAKLFAIRVLECEGGDFSTNSSMVLVHLAPALEATKMPHCSCVGVTEPPHCQDLPSYAFCGYMKFRHNMFRTTTYELLTESQKCDLHARSLLFLERYTRRCNSCGGGCFTRLLGLRCDDGLVHESKELNQIREQICALSTETKMTSDNSGVDAFSQYQMSIRSESNIRALLDSEDLRRLSRSMQMYRKDKRIRSFSSLELSICECLPILLSAYSQAIEHCLGADDSEKLFEAYLEYADLSIINMNIPQAVHLLSKVEEFVLSDASNKKTEFKWVKDFKLGRIHSLRGACLLECGDLDQARKELLQAMQLFCDPFPSSKNAVRFRNLRASFSQIMALFVVPQMYVATTSGFVGDFYEAIAWTLNRLYRLFNESKEMSNAALAAKWSMNYALRTDSNFRLLCVSYGNMISSYRQTKKFWMCQKLEKRSMELCQRKIGQVDVMEVHAIGYLYISIFLFYVEVGKKMESLEFGLSVMSIMTTLTDLPTRQILVLWILKLLLTEMRLQQMVAIMREFLFHTDHYDLSSETWYYYYAIVILLDTGYSVEPYRTCEKFYIKKGETILRTKTPEAPWNFFVCMWLVTIRTGAWERCVVWEERIKKLQTAKIEKHEYKIMILVRLAEGFLIMLVREIDNRNIKKIQRLHSTLKYLFKDMNKSCKHVPIFKPRVLLLSAYYYFIKGDKIRAYNSLNKASEWSKIYSHGTLLIWIEHTRDHWRGTLNPKLEHYWAEHIEADNVLDYRDFDLEKGKQIVPYTLPLPNDLLQKF